MTTTTISHSTAPVVPTPIQRKAARLAARPGAIRLRPDGSYSVPNSLGTTRYTTTPTTCNCQAGQRGRLCYHRVAVSAISKALHKAAAAQAAGYLEDLAGDALSMSFTEDFAGQSAAILYRACQLIQGGAVVALPTVTTSAPALAGAGLAVAA